MSDEDLRRGVRSLLSGGAANLDDETLEAIGNVIMSVRVGRDKVARKEWIEGLLGVELAERFENKPAGAGCAGRPQEARFTFQPKGWTKRHVLSFLAPEGDGTDRVRLSSWCRQGATVSSALARVIVEAGAGVEVDCWSCRR